MQMYITCPIVFVTITIVVIFISWESWDRLLDRKEYMLFMKYKPKMNIL